MGDVERSGQDSAKIIGNTSGGTLALVIAGFVALFMAGATVLDGFAEAEAIVAAQPAAKAAPQPVPRSAMLDEILEQQIHTRRDLAALRETLLERWAAPAATRPPTPAPACRETPAPACRPAPAKACRPSCLPALQRIDRYLASIADQASAIPANLPAGAVPDYGTRLEKLWATIAEARAYVRQQRRIQTASAERGEPEKTFLLAAVATAAPGSGPPAAELAWMKLYIVAGMFVVLGIVFVVAAVAIFTATDAARLTFATDTVKTLLGFFIGVITAFMGVPG